MYRSVDGEDFLIFCMYRSVGREDFQIFCMYRSVDGEDFQIFCMYRSVDGGRFPNILHVYKCGWGRCMYKNVTRVEVRNVQI